MLDHLAPWQLIAVFGAGWLVVAGAEAFVIYLFWPDLDGEDDWPWCDACRSYHHPRNETCFRLRGN